MVEVPAGEFIMGVSREEADQEFYRQDGSPVKFPSFYYAAVPRLRVYLDSFAIDQVEVTNVRYRRCVEAGGCSDPIPLQQPEYLIETEYDNYPALVTWYQARAYCQWVGKRLPTEAEWEKTARGTDERKYPWGDEWDETKANRGSDFSTLAPVSQYPDGASPFGALDMGGNVAEWVLADYEKYPGNQVDLPLDIDLAKIIRGNLWGLGTAVFRNKSRSDMLLEFIGFRCVSGSESVPLEEAVVDILTYPTPEPVASPDLSQAVYIPAGEFIMGSNNAYRSGQPERIIYLDAYYIDQNEVSVAEFVQFLNVLGEHRYACNDHHCVVLNPTDGRFEGFGQASYTSAGDSGVYEVLADQANYPVSFQNWYGSQAYCQWRGGRLPTSAEWEKVARGTDGRRYPWGYEWEPGRAVHAPEGKHYHPAYSYAQPVGSHPGDVSPYGALDMMGNAQEWVLDWFDPDYLAISPYENPPGPQRDEFDGFRTIRGLTDLGDQQEGLIMSRYSGSSYRPGIGFRCVYPALPLTQ